MQNVEVHKAIIAATAEIIAAQASREGPGTRMKLGPAVEEVYQAFLNQVKGAVSAKAAKE